MNYRKMTTYLLLALASILANTALCSHAEQQEPAQSQNVWLTIFLHGSFSIQHEVITLKNLVRCIRDNVENTVYYKTVEIKRKNPYFYKDQAIRDYGLHPIDLTDNDTLNGSQALAKVFNEVIALSSNAAADLPAPKNYYYTYGWSGLLSSKHRYQDAVKLYESLEQELARLKKQGIFPKIRIIGYSHGGNVALNLGAVQETKHADNRLSIDELILLGTPIQSETNHLVNSDIFKKVYNVFSTSDRIQKLDFFSCKRFFSRRIFTERQGFTLPKKLVQIQIKATRNNAKVHTSERKLALTGNFNNPSIISGKSHLLKDISPGHTELWYFGWTSRYYRPGFFSYPLPVAALLPFIIHQVQGMEHESSPYHPIIFDMRPEHDVALIKNFTKDKTPHVVDFIPHEEFKRLKSIAQPYAPHDYSPAEFDRHMHEAYVQASEFYRKEWSPKAKRCKRAQAKRELRCGQSCTGH
ncbi:MAG: hypothetical protein NTX86_01785 [Candidatus Dependentiae bacterium]|nr:hypothetical protein [Candidatus Dependentiae bacterium]